MPKFRYIGPSTQTTVGIAGARFYKGVVNEVPDERLAAQLIGREDFEEVRTEDLPAVTPAIRHAPFRQGQLYADPEVDAYVQDKIRQQSDSAKKLEHTGVDGLGQINRADQFAANVDALSGETKNTTELSSDSGGEEQAAPPASKPAGRTKKTEA